MADDDLAYRRVAVQIEPDAPPMAPADDDDLPLDPAETYVTVDIWLAVTVVEDSGDQVTIEQFGEQHTVPKGQLSEKHPAEIPGPEHDPVYGAHENSPYTSLDEVAEELKAELEVNDG